jgi:hypothetical protein
MPRLKKISALVLAVGVAACDRTPTVPRRGIPTGNGSPAGVVIRPDSIALFSKGAIATAVAGVVSSDGHLVSSLDGDIVWSVRDKTVVGNDGALGVETSLSAKQEGETWLVATAAVSGRVLTDSILVRVRWVSSATEKPTWAFHYGAVVTQSTLARYSSADALLEQMNALMSSVNAIFNTPGAFSGEFAFSVDSIYSIPDGSSQFPVVQPGSPLAGYIVFNESGAGSHFDPSTRNAVIGEPFSSPRFRRVVAHELGHSRGAVDLYFATVPPSEDPEARGYWAPSSLMNDNEPIWDTYSQLILDRNAANAIGENKWGTQEQDFPSILSIKVVTAGGTPVPGATVNTYAYAFGRSLEQANTPITGTTDASGVLRFAVNPFLRLEQRGRAEFRCRLGDCAQVIRVVVQDGTRSAQAWLPYWEVVSHRMLTGAEGFTRRMILGGPAY